MSFIPSAIVLVIVSIGLSIPSIVVFIFSLFSMIGEVKASSISLPSRLIKVIEFNAPFTIIPIKLAPIFIAEAPEKTLAISAITTLKLPNI